MSDDRKMGHVIPMKIYAAVFGTLVVLTVVTVVAAGVDFGSHLVNEVVAVGIAAIKATLVILFFMHAKSEKGETWAFIFYPFVILAIMLGGLFLDDGMRTKDSIKDRHTFTSITERGHHGDDHGDAKGHDAGATHAHENGETHSHADGETHSHDGNDDHAVDGDSHSHDDGKEHSHDDGDDH